MLPPIDIGIIYFMATLLLKNAALIATMNDADEELHDQSIFCENGIIRQIGPLDTLPNTADKMIDLSKSIVIPGMVNTHHHLFQNLTRVIPNAQNESLFGWLTTLYPIWCGLGPRHIYISSAVGLAELVLSGCTTSTDHQYLFPGGSRLDDSIEAAIDIGVRFHPTRGSMSIGESQGGLPPDKLTENENDILKDCERVISQFHDKSPNAMIKISLAPCSPFSVSNDLMIQTAVLARENNLNLHTHLAENYEDIEYSLAKFNMRPGEYAESLGWLGEDVWHAHCVQLNTDEVKLLGKTNTGIAHCPSSNMRLGSGIAPLLEMFEHKVRVGLGVDGSSSNDSGHMLNEARQAMLLQRVKHGASAITARDVLRTATRGGAKVLRQDNIGQIAPGLSADMAIYDMQSVDLAGTHTDPLAGLVFCGPVKTKHTIINGKFVVEDGHLTTMNINSLLEEHRKLSIELLNSA